MPQPENNEGFQRYCTVCGAELRAGTGFCVSCGASLSREPVESGPAYSQPSPEQNQTSADPAWDFFARLRRRFAGIITNLRGTNLGDAPRRAVNWLRDLPSVPKLVVAGLILLALLVVLSPVMRVVAVVAFVVSVAILIVQAVQRKPIRVWAVATLGALALIPVFGGISGALYDNRPEANADSGDELMYLMVVSEGLPSLDNRSDEELLGFGYDACDLLEDHSGDPEVVYDEMLSGNMDGYSGYEVGFVMRSGVEAFCPAYSSNLDYWDGSANDASDSPDASPSASPNGSASPDASVPSPSTATASASPAPSDTDECSLSERVFGKRDDGVFDINDDNNCNGTPDYEEDWDNDGQINLLDDDDYDGTADYLE